MGGECQKGHGIPEVQARGREADDVVVCRARHLSVSICTTPGPRACVPHTCDSAESLHMEPSTFMSSLKKAAQSLGRYTFCGGTARVHTILGMTRTTGDGQSKRYPAHCRMPRRRTCISATKACSSKPESSACTARRARPYVWATQTTPRAISSAGRSPGEGTLSWHASYLLRLCQNRVDNVRCIDYEWVL